MIDHYNFVSNGSSNNYVEFHLYNFNHYKLNYNGSNLILELFLINKGSKQLTKNELLILEEL